MLKFGGARETGPVSDVPLVLKRYVGDVKAKKSLGHRLQRETSQRDDAVRSLREPLGKYLLCLGY